MKNLAPLLITIAVILTGVFLWWQYGRQPQQLITNFDECAAAGNPIMETYPPQCRTADGRVFTQEVSQVPPIATPPSGRVPGAVVTVISQNLNTSINDVSVLTAYEREWPDSCLGLAKPGEFCAQVITPGWEVTVQAGGKTYVYRTNRDGSNVRLQK